MADRVVTYRINGHPITLFELGIVVVEGAQDHGVAGPGRQQIVDLRPHLIVATDPATGLQVEPIGARDQLYRLHGFVDSWDDARALVRGEPFAVALGAVNHVAILPVSIRPGRGPLP